MTLVHQVVCGLLIHDGRVLLGHRSPQKRWYPNVWDFPGGHIEPGETAHEALRRELREELGITVTRGERWREITLPSVRAQLWRVHAWEGEVCNLAPEEHDDLRWFTLSETQDLMLADDFYPELLRELLRGDS